MDRKWLGGTRNSLKILDLGNVLPVVEIAGHTVFFPLHHFPDLSELYLPFLSKVQKKAVDPSTAQLLVDEQWGLSTYLSGDPVTARRRLYVVVKVTNEKEKEHFRSEICQALESIAKRWGKENAGKGNHDDGSAQIPVWKSQIIQILEALQGQVTVLKTESSKERDSIVLENSEPLINNAEEFVSKFGGSAFAKELGSQKGWSSWMPWA